MNQWINQSINQSISQSFILTRYIERVIINKIFDNYSYNIILFYYKNKKKTKLKAKTY